MSSLVFPGLDVAAAGPTPVGPAAVGLTDPPARGGGFYSEGPGDDDSSESSSIGSPSSGGEDDDEDRGSDGQDEGESKSNKDDSTGGGSSSLGSLSSLEDSLPIKKGLSNHFAGKSRSFSNLSECAGAINVGDLMKHENPFNKRRRIQIVNRSSYKRRASCISLITTVLPPLLSPEHALQEEEEEEEDDDDSDDGNARRRCFTSLPLAPHGARFYSEAKIKKAALKSPRSFPIFEDLRYV